MGQQQTLELCPPGLKRCPKEVWFLHVWRALAREVQEQFGWGESRDLSLESRGLSRSNPITFVIRVGSSGWRGLPSHGFAVWLVYLNA